MNQSNYLNDPIIVKVGKFGPINFLINPINISKLPQTIAKINKRPADRLQCLMKLFQSIIDRLLIFTISVVLLPYCFMYFSCTFPIAASPHKAKQTRNTPETQNNSHMNTEILHYTFKGTATLIYYV